MTRKLLLILTIIMTLTIAAALAENSATTPSDLYENKVDDGHRHFAYCTKPNVCYRCGATVTVDANHIEHPSTKYVPYDATSHRPQCTACGVIEDVFEDNHIADCDNTGVCRVCGWTGKIDRIAHDERIVGDATGHSMSCSRCGKTSTKQAHYADCSTGAGKCERCGEPFDGPVQHFHGSNAVRYDAVYHWFKCLWCGKDIQEKHYAQNYYWYEDDSDLNCGGCGMAFRKTSSGTAGTTSSGSAGEVSDSADGEMTAAALHGNTEGLPMALVYAPRTGKATLREKASEGGRALGTFRDGTVVIVLEKGHRFTQVRVNGQTGYILTAALEEIDPYQRPLGEGMLTYPGAEGRTANVTGRIEPSATALVAEAWPAGTEVLIWSVTENGKWCEVEYEGLRAYVQAEYLTVTGPGDDDAEAI